jgi:DNA replication protein DnaC
MKLQGMANIYKSVVSMPQANDLSAHEMIAQMALAEDKYRTDKRTQMYLRMSKLRYDSVLENVNCSSQRNFSKDQLITLADCSFISNSQNVLITGATGCGKSYLACALGRQACHLGYRTIYWGMLRLVEKIQQTKLEGTFAKFLDRLNKMNLLIIDDFGIIPITNNVRVTLLQILEDRYNKKSTIIVSQLPFNKWYDYLGDKTLADAIMDRLSVAAYKLNLKGDSLRHQKNKIIS